ncbi:hypothetical protein DDR33_06780 [Pararcticibacter amylolyticus]|uniref:Uncharacterized protein n=1 Tax=Pararcticibacter amylolyticus TaxID=2173175 RepID=A0A2U2PJH2_9SPHI|nr:hypothetical protein DDR33_06780 [Pararcticibacter amylolyticus]
MLQYKELVVNILTGWNVNHLLNTLSPLPNLGISLDRYPEDKLISFSVTTTFTHYTLYVKPIYLSLQIKSHAFLPSDLHQHNNSNCFNYWRNLIL